MKIKEIRVVGEGAADSVESSVCAGAQGAVDKPPC